MDIRIKGQCKDKYRLWTGEQSTYSGVLDKGYGDIFAIDLLSTEMELYAKNLFILHGD